MKKILMGGAVTLTVALLLGMTTWNFAATQGAVQEKAHTPVHESTDEKLDRVQESVDDIKDLILELHTK
jgi:CHASE1-domain containing sensor protein